MVSDKSNNEEIMTVALKVHKELKQNYIKKQIFDKMFNKFKDMLLNRKQIEKILEDGETELHNA